MLMGFELKPLLEPPGDLAEVGVYMLPFGPYRVVYLVEDHFGSVGFNLVRVKGGYFPSTIQCSIPFHMVCSVLLRVLLLAQKTAF